MITFSPTQSDIETALGTFLRGILPSNVEVVVGQVNRVPEPSTPDFVIMWPILRSRLETNIDSEIDTVFTASMSANIMTVLSLSHGIIQKGVTVFGPGIIDGTTVTDFGTGLGGVGTYSINPPQNISSESMASGVVEVLQPVDVTIQCDVHGPNSANNAQIISTLFRDFYGVNKIQEINPDITPLYAEDPRQVPFINSEQQYEDRWIVDTHLQANQSVVVPQQFADAVTVDVINIEATYP